MRPYKPQADMLETQHIPLELMRTFVLIADNNGDASAAGELLQVSQPSVSKRLAALREITTAEGGEPWLILKGKRWLVTTEGQRVRGVVTDLVRRYEQVERFIADARQATPVISVACGQMAASGFVSQAISEFLKIYPATQVKLATPRGHARIAGVAGGEFDLAVVTDDPATIQEHARMDLYVQDLFMDRLLVVGNPAARSTWASAWGQLPVRRPLRAQELAGLPLILPESDATRRRQFDEWYMKHNGRAPQIAIEAGGWQNILRFAWSGLGVGLVTQQTISNAASQYSVREQNRLAKSVKALDENDFPPDAVRLICRRVYGQEIPDLRPQASELLRLIASNAKA